ncbi:MAG: hypothetical protein AB7F98_02540 [Novosphingobium sp.]
MLYPSGLSAFAFTYDNWGANPSSTPGTSVVPGATNAEGAWTQIASSANISQDCYWLYLQVHSGATSAQAKNHLLDLGIDAAGGTGYTPFFDNLVVGASPALTVAGNREFLFPVFIPAGASVAVRMQGSNATAGTVRVMAKFYGQPTKVLASPRGAFSQTFATIAGSNGTGFTPGNAADGAWVDLGSASRNLWWFQLGYQIDNSTITAEYTYIDVAWGDATNKQNMFRVMHGGTTGETCGLAAQTQLLFCAACNPVPAGANIYIRGRCNNAPDTGYNASVVGIGG